MQTRTRPKRQAKAPTEKPAAAATRVADWMFGDYGPFGWNDPLGVQGRVDRMGAAEHEAFVRTLCRELRERLAEVRGARG